MTKDKFIEAVRTLVDAVLTEHCLPAGANDGVFNEEFVVKAAIAVLREIRASQEHSSLHKWADKRLLDHSDAYELPYDRQGRRQDEAPWWARPRRPSGG